MVFFVRDMPREYLPIEDRRDVRDVCLLSIGIEQISEGGQNGVRWKRKTNLKQLKKLRTFRQRNTKN